ncbi:MAG TPA: hypothetical protein VF306_01865 [Pirellulales bacterium]
MADTNRFSSFDRRDFARRILGGAVAAPLATAAVANDARAADPSTKVAAPEPQQEEDLYLALVNRLDADRLRPEHLKQIRNELAGHLARSKRLSAFPLTNADEPAPVYSAYRAED